MKKKGKKKLFAVIGICMVFLLVASVFMAAGETVKEAVQNAADTPKIAQETYKFVENFVEKKGISPESINNVKEVDFNSLPKEVNIKNVNDANLAIYQIDYNKTQQEQDKVFVIAYSVDKLKAQGDIIVSQDKREFLNFGFSGEMTDSGFLKTATNVESSSEKGYVMIRKGSITGISTNLEVLEGAGQLEVIIYKNGEAIQFGNTFAVNFSGIQKDYDVQSEDTVTFEPGDIISVYVKSSSGISWKDVITLLEITTEN